VILYVDTSALLKIYLGQPEASAAERFLTRSPGWATGWHTYVEVRRNLARALEGQALTLARNQFERHWSLFQRITLDAATCLAAADIAERTGLRSLDALHLGAAQRVGRGRLPFLTYDGGQARAARSLGWTVLGT
jgi:predicted nucleic acid-binding protein